MEFSFARELNGEILRIENDVTVTRAVLLINGHSINRISESKERGNTACGPSDRHVAIVSALASVIKLRKVPSSPIISANGSANTWHRARKLSWKYVGQPSWCNANTVRSVIRNNHALNSNSYFCTWPVRANCRVEKQRMKLLYLLHL